MRYRKVLGLAILLVALAVVINALAFSTAGVTNGAKISIVSTGDAALGIGKASNPALTSPGVVVNLKNATEAELVIGDPMQPNSEYWFDNVYRISNNSSKSMTIAAPSFTGLPSGVTIEFFDTVDNKKIGLPGASGITTISNGTGHDLHMKVTVASGATLTNPTVQDFTIVWSATQNP